MNYIYDILLNFNNEIYEFFEWEGNDNIIHIKKIPLFRINSDELLNLVNNKIKFDNEFLTNIYNKTELYTKNNIKNIPYSFIITDKKYVIAITLDNNGFIKKYSKLLIDEEEDVIEYSYNIHISNLKYEIISKIKHNNFQTRSEKRIKEFIFKEIRNMINNNEIDKLKYLYLDCFNENKLDNIIYNVYKKIEENWSNVYFKVYNFLKLTATKR